MNVTKVKICLFKKKTAGSKKYANSSLQMQLPANDADVDGAASHGFDSINLAWKISTQVFNWNRQCSVWNCMNNGVKRNFY